MKGRMFKLRLRPGRAVLSSSKDGTDPYSGEAGEEIVVPESVAAFLVRQRAVDIVEVIEPTEPATQDPPE